MKHIIREWLPDWSVSHAQLADTRDGTLQSRSWDIVIHKPVPPARGYPPAATSDGNMPLEFPLVPKELCCAIIDVKGYLTPSDLRSYCKKNAYDIRCTKDTVSQFEFIGDSIPKVLFCFTSTATDEAMRKCAEENGTHAYVLSKAKFDRSNNGLRKTLWLLQSNNDAPPPQRFRLDLEKWAASWFMPQFV